MIGTAVRIGLSFELHHIKLNVPFVRPVKVSLDTARVPLVPYGKNDVPTFRTTVEIACLLACRREQLDSRNCKYVQEVTCQHQSEHNVGILFLVAQNANAGMEVDDVEQYHGTCEEQQLDPQHSEWRWHSFEYGRIGLCVWMHVVH